jgi:hypothetical protein
MCYVHNQGYDISCATLFNKKSPSRRQHETARSLSTQCGQDSWSGVWISSLPCAISEQKISKMGAVELNTERNWEVCKQGWWRFWSEDVLNTVTFSLHLLPTPDSQPARPSHFWRFRKENTRTSLLTETLPCPCFVLCRLPCKTTREIVTNFDEIW